MKFLKNSKHVGCNHPPTMLEKGHSENLNSSPIPPHKKSFCNFSIERGTPIGLGNKDR